METKVSEEEFIRLLVAHEGELRAFAHALVPQSALAEDVLQEASIAMWRKLSSLDSAEVFRSWAHAYVRFTALNLKRRKEETRLVFSPEVIEALAETWEASSEARGPEDLVALRRCVERLPEASRDLVRRYYADTAMTVETLARQVSRPVAGIYKTLQRARTWLRECVERDERRSQIDFRTP